MTRVTEIAAGLAHSKAPFSQFSQQGQLEEDKEEGALGGLGKASQAMLPKPSSIVAPKEFTGPGRKSGASTHKKAKQKKPSFEMCVKEVRIPGGGGYGLVFVTHLVEQFR